MRDRILIGAALSGLVLFVRVEAELGMPQDRKVADIQRCEAYALPGIEDSRLEAFAGFAFRLPTTFRPYDSKMLYEHGGQAWRSGRRQVELVYGYWGPSSFPFGTRRCEATINGIPTLLVEQVSDTSVAVLGWYRLNVAENRAALVPMFIQPTLRVSSTDATDLPLLRAILLSVIQQ